jgi:glycerophosphoryl diester phosphodiesterase
MTRKRLRRVGHKGADLIAPGNTLQSFDAALAAGVDVIEFDVLREGDRLLLAHDYEDAGRRSPHTLEEGLSHLAASRFGEVELDVDLKLPGYEHQVVEALRSFDLLDRTIISTQYRSSLRVIRRVAPEVRLGWSVPRLRRDPFRSRVMLVPALIAMVILRTVLPTWAGAELRRRRCDALMVHWRLVTPRLVQRVALAGGELYVWTVDELPRLRALEALGVTGVITNDPRLFAALV